MAKYELDINVKASTKGATSTTSTRADLRERMQQTQELKKALATQQGKQPQLQSIQQLDRTLLKLDKSINTLNRSTGILNQYIAKQTGTRFYPSGGGGGTGGGRGGGSGLGALAGVGAAAGAFGYVMSKVLQVGRANIEKRMEQTGTAGVAGTQLSGKQLDIFSAAEFGQYLKERRMQAGSFDVGKGEYARSTDVSSSKQASFKTIATFGASPQETARTVGLLDIMTQNKGETAFGDILKATYRKEGGKIKGIGTEIPVMLQAVTDQLQTAVTEGVNDSNMARDMAGELARMGSVTSTGQIRSAIQTQKTIMGIQESVGRRQVQSYSDFQMRQSTRLLMSGHRGSQVQSQLQSKLEDMGIIEKGEDISKLSPQKQVAAISYLNQTKDVNIRGQFMRSMVERFTPTKGTQSEKFSTFYSNISSAMPGEFGQVSQAKLIWDLVRKQKTEKLTNEEFNEQMTKITSLGTHARSGKAMKGGMEELTLGTTGQEAAKTVVTVNTAMMNFAKDMNTTVTDSLKTFNSLLSGSVKGLAKLLSIVDDTVSFYQDVGSKVAAGDFSGAWNTAVRTYQARFNRAK